MNNNRELTTKNDINDMYSFIEKESSVSAASKRKRRSVWNIVFNVFVVVLLVLLLLFFIQIRVLKKQGESSNINGYKIYSIQSDDMEPILMKDTLIIAKLYEGQNVDVGDIIICYNEEGQRIIKKVDGYTNDQMGLYVSDCTNDTEEKEIVLYEKIEAIYKGKL